MSNDNAGRSPRSTSGGAPMGSTIAIVVTAVAVVLGFLILRKINDGGDTGSVAPQTTLSAETTVDPNVSTTIAFTTTTAQQLVTTGTKVQVANASNASGTARQMSTALAGKGFDMADATNSTLSPKLDLTKVIYDANDPNALAVANSVAVVLGNVVVEVAPVPPPVESGAFAEGSGVIVLLGNDLAGKTLPAIAGEPTTGTTALPTTTLAGG
ncbi:MAG: LytR C-terminal domain-containing protein [Actinobacteria bacterium]|nr:LytR C-terminal domain-containing protein [Actinomycetota bacterium]